MRTLGGFVVAVLSIVAAPIAQAPQTVLVFAAASMKGALDEVGAIVTRRTGVAMKVSYAATSTLAKQIEEGAPADIFVSADEQWMDYLAARTLVAPASRVNVVSNRLVLIAPKDPKNPDQRPALAIAPGFGLAAALGPSGRLAVADPASVPAGRYGKAALTALGVWPGVASRLAPADNVRAALAFVARGEAPLGIVYQSDVIAEPGVAIVGIFPERTHPRIVYPAALTVRARPEAKAVLDVIASAEARAVFVKHGFVAPGS
jgi:molybdate transport system substrate-binding protein